MTRKLCVVYFALCCVVLGCNAKPDYSSASSKQEYRPGSKLFGSPEDAKAQVLHPHKRAQEEIKEAYEEIQPPSAGPEPRSGKDPRGKPFGYPAYDEKTSVTTPTRRAETNVSCQKNHMIANIKFSTQFNGYIYIHGQFPDCIVFRGQQSTEAALTLHHGKCAQRKILNEADPDFTPLIEHRLVIQWEKDFICEDDSSVIVRCDRPDDFNKTISWDFNTLELQATFEQGQHPGPNMFMELQVGEGPTAPALTNQNIFIGDVMTLVFTLSDNVFWFDSDMLSCTAKSGSGEVTQLELGKHVTSSYAGHMQVIENDCSLKPKLFSKFRKDKVVQTNNLITIHYAYFKAFRFPTSNKVVLQCDVRICYKECDALPDCSNPFHPRSAEHTRKRRDLSAVAQDKVEPFKKTFLVYAKEDFAVSKEPLGTIEVAQAYELEEVKSGYSCFSPVAFFTWVGLLSFCSMILLTIIIFGYRTRQENVTKG